MCFSISFKQDIICNEYSYSCHDKKRGREETSIGWSDAGIQYYNNLCKATAQDCQINGDVFNRLLFQTIDGHLSAKASIMAKKKKKAGGRARKERVVPYDDLGPAPLPQGNENMENHTTTPFQDGQPTFNQAQTSQRVFQPTFTADPNMQVQQPQQRLAASFQGYGNQHQPTSGSF